MNFFYKKKKKTAWLNVKNFLQGLPFLVQMVAMAAVGQKELAARSDLCLKQERAWRTIAESGEAEHAVCVPFRLSFSAG